MICILLSVRYSVTAFVAISERDVRSILPVAHRGNVHVRYSTYFFVLENVGKIKKNVKNVKKTFFTSMVWVSMVELVGLAYTLDTIRYRGGGLSTWPKMQTQQNAQFIHDDSHVGLL